MNEIKGPLTNPIVTRYASGVAEVVNFDQKTILRGKIAEIAVRGGKLAIHFSSRCKNRGQPGTRSQDWDDITDLDYVVDRASFLLADIGKGLIQLTSESRKEMVILSPAAPISC